jgi:Secretion system C-terminal sorting domain
MKILVSIILSLWFAINTGTAQSFPNIDLSQVPLSCIGSNGEDKFAIQQLDGCNTKPWFVAHGTPDILQDRSILVGSGIDSKFDGKESEGVVYKQPFVKGKLYVMSITFTVATDALKVFLGNGVPISNSFNTPTSNPNPRSFKIPNVSDKQIVFESGNTNTNTITKQIGFIPNKDYECLWFYADDNHEIPPDGGLSIATFKVSFLTCDAEPTKEITSTNSLFDYGARGNGLPFHIPLQPTLSASNKINIIPRSFVDIYENTRIHFVTVRLDPKVNLIAGKSILIKPDNNQSRSVFQAAEGSVFSAKISTSIGCEDACEGYLPWSNSYCGLTAPTLINKCDIQPAFTEFRLVSSYPKSYNAYRAEMIVYRTGTDITFPIFTKVWEDPLKKSLPEACIVWKPGPLDYGNYNVYIKLTNCNGDYEVKNADNTRFDVTVACGSPLPDERGQVSTLNKADSNSLAYQIKYNTQKGVNITVYPNPTTGLIKIQSNSDIRKAVIKITNILGMNEVSIINDNIQENSSFEYDMSHLPTGVYIVSIISDNKIISRTKISKL